jgi:hypothetical protein
MYNRGEDYLLHKQVEILSSPWIEDLSIGEENVQEVDGPDHERRVLDWQMKITILVDL